MLMNHINMLHAPTGWLHNRILFMDFLCTDCRGDRYEEEPCEMSFTRNPIASKPSVQSRHRSERQGEVFQMQAGHPRAMGLPLSSLAFHANRL